jgi:hypothetical protein
MMARLFNNFTTSVLEEGGAVAYQKPRHSQNQKSATALKQPKHYRVARPVRSLLQPAR